MGWGDPVEDGKSDPGNGGTDAPGASSGPPPPPPPDESEAIVGVQPGSEEEIPDAGR